jgi:hypothetical protein
MALNWINPEDYSFNSFLLLERFQIRLMFEQTSWLWEDADWKRSMGIALRANPAVQWYFVHRCPELAATITAVAQNAPANCTAQEIRQAEMQALAEVEDFIIYTTPEQMAEKCDFIRGWDKKRLLKRWI